MGEFLAKFLGFIDNKNTRLAVAAITIASLLIACSIAITSLSYEDGWHFRVRPEFQVAFVIAYLVLFVTSWFILYLLNVKDGTDVYSEARENLVGQWVVNYQANVGPRSKQIVVSSRTVGCYISVNDLQKLELVFTVHDNPVFNDDDRQVIRDVAVRSNEAGGYTMFYYYSARRGLKSTISGYILPETEGERADEAEVEIFGLVSFEKPLGHNRVERMDGKWFDLNGNVSRLFALLDAQKVAEIREEKFEPIRLSQVPIHQKNFDADMGGVNFARRAAA